MRFYYIEICYNGVGETIVFCFMGNEVLYMDELYNNCSYVSCIVDECNDIIIYNVYHDYTELDVDEMLQVHPEWSLRFMPEFI